MESDLLRLEKKILSEQHDRFLKAHESRKFMHLRFLFDYIQNTTFFKELAKRIIDENSNRFSHSVYHIVHGKEQMFIPDDYKERSSLAFLVVEGVVKANQEQFLINAARKYITNQQGDKAMHYATFNELFVEPFISFFLNQYDQKIAIAGILRSYKHRTEWFNREHLHELAVRDNGRKEKRLAGDLYSYLFDKGFDFFIQPTSPSGEIDFLASQKNSPMKLLVEAKVFDGHGRHKQHIISGFKQVVHYAKDFHEHSAFLVVFNTSDRILAFPGGLTPEGMIEISTANSVIYVLVIDICLHENTASKRPLGETVSFVKEDFT